MAAQLPSYWLAVVPAAVVGFIFLKVAQYVRQEKEKKALALARIVATRKH